MTDADYVDDLALLTNTPAQAKSQVLGKSKQQEALVSTWTQIKQCSYVLSKMEPSPH